MNFNVDKVKRMLNLLHVDITAIKLDNREYTYNEVMEILISCKFTKDELLKKAVDKVSSSIYPRLVANIYDKYPGDLKITPTEFGKVLIETIQDAI